MKENGFYQTSRNIEKAGAYYTDLSHCQKISQLFLFPDEEVCILEPSAGDGSAVKMVTKACNQRKIFAVELQKEAAMKLKEDEEIFEVLQTDFLSTKISHGVFSFCFANPPYIEGENGRVEVEFLKRLSGYVANEGILVLIVSIATARNKSFLRAYLSKFCPLYEFRFMDSEYDKYKQIVFIGRKSKDAMINNGILDEYMYRKKEDYPVVPESWEGKDKINVFSSFEKDVKIFTSQVFDSEKAYADFVRIDPQKKNYEQLVIGDFHETDELARPPVMPNINTLYLLSTLGCGSGLTGTVEGKDIHLQRGCARIIKRTFDDMDESGNIEEVTQTSTQVSVTIIQNNGKIEVLE